MSNLAKLEGCVSNELGIQAGHGQRPAPARSGRSLTVPLNLNNTHIIYHRGNPVLNNAWATLGIVWRPFLDELETQGLPDDADYQMHEDFIEWEYWHDVATETEKALGQLKLSGDRPGGD